MQSIKVEEKNVDVYNINDFPYNKLLHIPTIARGRRRYANVVSTFDIETTTIKAGQVPTVKEDFGFMYIWQFCINGIVVIGRTWSEYQEFVHKLGKIMMLSDRDLVCYVHNLSFEFQFMRNFFEVTRVFAKDKRKIVSAVMEGIEYRCSYILTNMGLDKFLSNTPNVTFKKQSGKDFNYKILRYPDTKLSDMELAYCVCDVLGLWEAITEKLKEDDLISIPLTSTGYVRRDYKEVCRNSKEHMDMFYRSKLSEEDYTLCKEASRGAISGSNHLFTNELIEYVESFDIKSSYPYQMATKYFPQTKFLKIKCKYGTTKFQYFLENFCCLITWTCSNLCINRWEAIPYISKAKCRAIEDFKVGNGKVYKANRIGMCCTEIDFRIISELYTFDNVEILDMRVAERGMLSKPFREHLLYMFQEKTNLEDGDPYLYGKFKNKINSSFGMMLTDILNPEIEYISDTLEPFNIVDIEDTAKALKMYYGKKNSFLSYQHGVWVLAHARDSLNNGMQIVKRDIVQVDTDSVKCVCDMHDYKPDFEALNDKIKANAENYDVKPYSIKNGEKVYLGVWEYEGTYRYFKTLGAKKYCYDKNGEMTIVVAGLKKSANKWLMEHGGYDAFANGTVVPAGVSGRTSAIYNDEVRIKHRFINGHEIEYSSNIAINDIEYTFGITSEWLELILDGEISNEVDLGMNGSWWS